MAFPRIPLAAWSEKWRSSHRDVALYTASSVARTAAQFIASLITVRLIAPEELGLWSSISLATTYAFFLQAGVTNGLGRELPYQLGAGDSESAKRLAGTSQTFVLGGSLLVVLAGLVALVACRDQGPAALLCIVAVIPITVATLYQNFLTVTFRSKSSFLALAKTQFWTAGLVVLSLPILYYWGFDGLLLRAVLVTVAGVWLMHHVRPIRVANLWDGPSFKTLMMTGLPIFALAYLESISVTADRLVLLKYGGVEQVGFYSLAMYAWQALTILPMSLGQYVYPRMTYSYGKDNDPRALWASAWKVGVLVLVLMTPIALLCALAVPWAVPLFFPKYVSGVPAAQILIFASVFYGAVIGVNALWSLKAWKHMVACQVIGAGLRVGCPLLGACLLASPLSGVAWGMFAACAVNFFVGLALTYSATHRHAVPVTPPLTEA